MKEFKGTKGEWNLSEDINDNERVCIVSESNDNFIDVWSLNLATEDEMRANAKLIAAAPELLKALQSAYKCSGERNKLTKPVLDEMLNAINKALN